MKREYVYTTKEDVKACKELVKIMIKRDLSKCGEANEAKNYAYQVARFFDCMETDFRMDFVEWIEKEIEKKA